MALLRKMTSKIRHLMRLRHRVFIVLFEIAPMLSIHICGMNVNLSWYMHECVMSHI